MRRSVHEESASFQKQQEPRGSSLSHFVFLRLDEPEKSAWISGESEKGGVYASAFI
jgi:hypothetical protein